MASVTRVGYAGPVFGESLGLRGVAWVCLRCLGLPGAVCCWLGLPWAVRECLGSWALGCLGLPEAAWGFWDCLGCLGLLGLPWVLGVVWGCLGLLVDCFSHCHHHLAAWGACGCLGCLGCFCCLGLPGAAWGAWGCLGCPPGSA